MTSSLILRVHLRRATLPWRNLLSRTAPDESTECMINACGTASAFKFNVGGRTGGASIWVGSFAADSAAARRYGWASRRDEIDIIVRRRGRAASPIKTASRCGRRWNEHQTTGQTGGRRTSKTNRRAADRLTALPRPAPDIRCILGFIFHRCPQPPSPSSRSRCGAFGSLPPGRLLRQPGRRARVRERHPRGRPPRIRNVTGDRSCVPCR